MLHILMQYSV